MRIGIRVIRVDFCTCMFSSVNHEGYVRVNVSVVFSLFVLFAHDVYSINVLGLACPFCSSVFAFAAADVSEISKHLSSQAEQFKWSSKKLSLMVRRRIAGRRGFLEIMLMLEP